MTLTIANSLEVPKPSCWPISMTRFGSVPSGSFKGEPIYRVVFAPTVRKLVFGQFSDGYIGARSRPSYPQIGQKWILEKWTSGFEDTKLSPAEYERWGPRDPQSGMLINGPYPHDGVYNHCWTFDKIEEISGVETIIGLIHNGAKRSLAQIKAGNAEIDAREEKKAAEQRYLRCRETEPLYGVRAASFAGTPKAVNHKTVKTPIAANDLGLPTRRGSVVSMRGPKVNLNGSI
jgi:hypothetical protein